MAIENNKNINESDLIIPVYINEKIVLDMLAIVEDGFSLVSKINYTEDNANSAKGEIAANVSTDSILGKFLKIDFSPKASGEIDQNTTNNVQTEKVHTNVSLLSKFRKYLIEHNLLKTGLKFEELSIGDFIEINGELQKNPSLEYFDRVVDVLELVNAIMPSAELGNKNNQRNQKENSAKGIKLIKSFTEELKTSGTVDFCIKTDNGTVVISAQTQYLENANVSEIIGGEFKVLAKVIAIKGVDAKINLLRKTPLAVFPNDAIKELFGQLNTEDMKAYNLPELVTEIPGPALIAIPVAIYA